MFGCLRYLALASSIALVVLLGKPVGAQLSTKPSGSIHGRMTHVDRRPRALCRDARGRVVACAKRKAHDRSR